MAKYTNGTASAAIKATAGRVYGVVANSHTNGTVRLNDGASTSTSAGVKASGVFTLSGAADNGETVTIGGRTYTFRTALTAATTANEVLIGANAAASLDNLKSAINASAGGGTTYGSDTVAHPLVTATTNTDTAQTVEYWVVGTAGNSLGTTETTANGAWGATTLASGAEPSTLITNTYTFASGSGSLIFPEPIEFVRGLYLTVGGTLDYTVIWD